MSSHHHSAVFLPRSLNIRLNHTVTKKDSTAYWVQEGFFIRNNDSENDLEDDLDMALSNLGRDANFKHYKCPSLRQIILRQIIFDAAGTFPSDDTLAMALTVMPAHRQGVREHRVTRVTEDAVATTTSAAAFVATDDGSIGSRRSMLLIKNETDCGAQKRDRDDANDDVGASEPKTKKLKVGSDDRAKRDRDDANDNVGASEPKTKKLKVSSDVDNDESMA